MHINLMRALEIAYRISPITSKCDNKMFAMETWQ